MQIEKREPILSFDRCHRGKEFHRAENTITCGEIDAGFRKRMHTLGRIALEIGGQEHFYLESQAAIAMPGEAWAGDDSFLDAASE